ncbi:MAG TPA: TOBE domain-containing protein [Symbiobacteriaceae bacterium]|jgi:molybdopterin-binding protein
MKLSTRNQLKATVKSVETQGLMSKVILEVGGQTLTAMITADAVNELELKTGEHVSALIKSTSVMVAK